MANKNHKINLLLSIFLLLLQLGFLFFMKYFNQDLSISEFSLKNIGNIFNVIIFLGIILGIYTVTKQEKLNKPGKTIFSFIFLSWLLLIISFITTKVKILSKDVYLFNQPGDKLLTGILLMIYLFVLFYFFISIWSRIFIKNKQSFMRNIFSTVLMLILLLLFVFIFIEEKNYSADKWKFSKNKNNIAVVLGAAVWSGNIPSPTLSRRVDKVLDLLNEGIVKKIVLTGGNAPGEMTESEVAYEYAKAKGIDTSRVIIEKNTSSTSDQIKWIKKNLSEYYKNGQPIILISDAYHLPRAIEISKFFNLNLRAAESVHHLDFKDKLFSSLRESIALFIFWNFAL
jgi:vancomycin permeability regulator SanA